MNTSITNGGFGMVNIEDIMHAACRLKRFSYLAMTKAHPVAGLQEALDGMDHLKRRPVLDIDDITTQALSTLRSHYIRMYDKIPHNVGQGDLILHRLLLWSNIKDVIIEGRTNSIEMVALRHRGVLKVADIVLADDNSDRLLVRITSNELARNIQQLKEKYQGRDLLGPEMGITLTNLNSFQWHQTEMLTSRQIRSFLVEEQLIDNSKILQQTEDEARKLYIK
jgi:hypothetical protein